MAGPVSTVAKRLTFMERLKQMYYHSRNFPKYGLLHDDIYSNDSEGILKEAVKRLPPDVAEARQFRITRAIMLSARKEYLPRDQWTDINDPNHLYLKATYDAVKAEREMKSRWEKK